ncbi:MAG: PhnB protein [Acidimicrobiia bacterium]|nr:PhnB protein [Acidimicrobiia bacterium]
MLSIYSDVKKFAELTEAEGGSLHQEYYNVTKAMVDSGVFSAGDPLEGIHTAKTVSKNAVTDGPFADIAEHLGGFYILELPSIEAACEWAAKLPGVARGLDRIEVRPVQEMPDMPR